MLPIGFHDPNLTGLTSDDKHQFYVDVDFPINSRTVAAGQPSTATLIGNLTAPQWDINDFFVCEGEELVHEWVEGSEVFWHVHFYQTPDATDSYLNWQIEYTWTNSSETGETVPATTTVTSGDILIPGGSGLKLFVYPVASFTPTGGKIAAHVKPRLTRIASSGTAPTNDPFCEMLQLHVRVNSPGSRQEFIK